jgi:hypothetical protein
VSPMSVSYDSAADLAQALRRAEAAHGQPDWPDWYARYMVDEQAAHPAEAGQGTSA